MRLVIVTGMSGAGKTAALKMLEDMGFYCVDNLPIPLYFFIHFQDLSLIYFGSLKELFSETIRLKTGLPGSLSRQSTQKYPLRTNWKLSNGFASFRPGSK